MFVALVLVAVAVYDYYKPRHPPPGTYSTPVAQCEGPWVRTDGGTDELPREEICRVNNTMYNIRQLYCETRDGAPAHRYGAYTNNCGLVYVPEHNRLDWVPCEAPPAVGDGSHEHM